MGLDIWKLAKEIICATKPYQMVDRNDLVDLFRYNAWANARYRKVLKAIPLEELRINTNYGILLDRIVHIFASFEMWYERMHQGSPSSVCTGKDFQVWEELEKAWLKSDHLLLEYVEQLESEDMEKIVSYTSLDGKKYTRKIKHILLHLTQHPTYHRGQISSIFKEKKLPKLPPTDIVVYFKSLT